jgi:hypothetical protein
MGYTFVYMDHLIKGLDLSRIERKDIGE